MAVLTADPSCREDVVLREPLMGGRVFESAKARHEPNCSGPVFATPTMLCPSTTYRFQASVPAECWALRTLSETLSAFGSLTLLFRLRRVKIGSQLLLITRESTVELSVLP